MTGFSVVPLQLFTFFGLALALGNLAFALYMFWRRITHGPEAGGIFTLFAILYFFVGVGILGLGIIGEYIGRIYQEVRRRPRFVIRHVYESVDDD